MPLRLTRAWITRVAVAAALVASSLIAVAPAQAALGGGPAEQTQNLPDLVSATILTSSSAGGGNVDYCFDKAIASGSVVAATPKFLLGGYYAANSTPATAAVLEQNVPSGTCVRATFPVAAGDINQYTIATLLPGGPTGNVPGSSNTFGDSVPLTGSVTHNGTTGFTVAPDLTGVTVDTTSNTITYTEDQGVATFTGVPSGVFSFTDASGNVCSVSLATTAAAVTTAKPGSSITVPFTGATCTGTGTPSVATAVRASQGAAAFGAAADPGAPNNFDTAIIPNAPNGGATTHPDLTAAQLDPAVPGAMDFTFDQGSLTLGPATSFFADLSTGDQIAGVGGSAVVTAATPSSTTVRVSFLNLANYNEYVVKGSVGVGAVVGSGITPGTAGSANAGGNAGAFGRGFTTAPDAFSVLVHTGTGLVTVNLDQRAFNPFNVADISLLGVTGTAIANPTNVALPPQAAGPQAATLTFTPPQAGNAVNLALENGSPAGTAAPGATGALLNPLSTNGVSTDQANVDQIIHVTTTAAIAKAAKRTVAYAKTHKVSRAAANRAHARYAKVERSRLAKLLRQIKAGKKHHKK